MLLDEKLQTFREVEELVQQAVTRLESLERYGVPGNYDLAVRQHLVEALTKLMLGAQRISAVADLAKKDEQQDQGRQEQQIGRPVLPGLT